MPNWNELDGGNWNPMRAKVAPKEEKVAPLTREQAASAIHKITGAMPGYGGAAPLKHTLYIPDGYTPWIEVVGDRVTVEMRTKEEDKSETQRLYELTCQALSSFGPSPVIPTDIYGPIAYATSSDMEAYWDSVAEWVDAQAAGMPKAE